MLNFWQENNSSKKTTDTYFNVKTGLFEKYLAGFSSNMFLDNKSEMIAILWGSVYIYDFFHKRNIISEEIFLDFVQTTKELKGKIIGQYTPDLWNSNFIHSWKKPDCISETEFLEENKIFKKSITFKYQKFSRLRSNISEELSKIGELSHFIIEGGKSDLQRDDTNLLENLFNSPVNEIGEFDNHNNTYEPIKAEKKVGRNEPCPCGSGKKYKKCCGQK
ncbi:MAG: SEC-C domain-containing protein [Mariniphaga sp.]|nr:SEC-C domain-containing protein [Mariniphaga sp.]